MKRLRAIIALCLATLWLPATLCCAMDAAGWDILCSSESCHGDNAAAESNDGCSLVEDGRYRSVVPELNVAPAIATVCLCLICVPAEPSLAEMESLRRPAAAETWPRDGLPTWHFVRRAAAPAHAPDALNA